jgi:hypothetical protein
LVSCLTTGAMQTSQKANTAGTRQLVTGATNIRLLPFSRKAF